MRAQDDEVIDGNAIFKHMQKLHSEKEFRQRFQRLDFAARTPKQVEIFNDPHRFLSIRAGNRSGKTEGVCQYSACAALDRWPAGHSGYVFIPPKIVRSTTFDVWVIGPDGVSVRDVQMQKLLGGLTPQELGTGWLPLSALRHPITLSRGVSGLADKVLVTRDDGSLCSIKFLTAQMDRQSFQGAAVDLIILDEDPGRKGGEIWPELVARGVGVGGRIIHTATPLAGLSPIRQFFREGGPDRGEIRMSIYNNTFLTPEDIRIAESSYSERERQTRLYGDDLPGYGAVFNIDEKSYLHDMTPQDIPSYWPWINGMDFSHFGMSSQAHPWAFVSCAVDPNTETVYVMHALRIKQALPESHVAALKKWGAWDAPCTYGADGAQRTGSAGDTFMSVYRDWGIPMRLKHATMRDGSVSLEASLAMMESLLAQGRLKIARHLIELRDELRDLHYDENNKYVAEADDLVSALRYAAMDMRYAKPLGGQAYSFRGKSGEPQIADGYKEWNESIGL